MLIQNWMSRPVVTIDAGASMPMARDLLKQHNIHCLPVMKKNKLVGILTDSDLKRASASDATSLDVYELAYLLQKIRINQIMTPNPTTIPFDYTLAEAADVFLKNNVSALPVMKGQDQMVGIITPSDISRSFLCLTAAGRQGIQIGVQVEDQAGIVMSLVDIIRSAGGQPDQHRQLCPGRPSACLYQDLQLRPQAAGGAHPADQEQGNLAVCYRPQGEFP